MSDKPTYEELEQRVRELEMAESERKQAEEALKESERKLQKILATVPLGIGLIVNRELRWSNDRMHEMLGYPNGGLFGESARILYENENEYNRVGKIAYEMIRKNGIVEVETQWKRKDNSVFDCLIRIAPLNISNPSEGNIAVISDITERKQAAEALRESEKQLSNAMKMAHLGHWKYDVANDLFTFNDHFYRIFRTTAKQVGGYTMSSAEYVRRFVHPGDMSVVEEETRKAIEATDPHFNRQFEHRMLYADGTVGYIIVRFFIVKDSQNRTVRTYGVNQDITERKRLSEEREKLETLLQQSQKMESIGKLAGGIAHDFNNILSPIMIHSEMAMMELPPGSPLQQNMKQIFKAGERARDLVKQILTFARKQERELVPLRVSQILKEAIKFLRSSIPTTIDIQYDINSEQDIVLSDPTQLNQIIINMCTNAAHAMEEKGGTLEVVLTNENLDSESADEFPDLEPGRYVKLAVKDTGHGIEPQLMDKIFEPYFTTKEVGKGTGMGLALVHGIVKSYGGTITVQSEVGKGTSFHVYLPLVEEEIDVLETAKDSVPIPRGAERVLFVDDEKVTVDAFQPMLESLGYKVTARTSSIEALEAFRNNPQRFDLVITDMTMPNMTGKDLAKELMMLRSDIPIILCTGFSEKIDERRTEEMGISAYVMKPIVMRDMANTIREVLDKK